MLMRTRGVSEAARRVRHCGGSGAAIKQGLHVGGAQTVVFVCVWCTVVFVRTSGERVTCVLPVGCVFCGGSGDGWSVPVGSFGALCRM